MKCLSFCTTEINGVVLPLIHNVLQFWSGILLKEEYEKVNIRFYDTRAAVLGTNVKHAISPSLVAVSPAVKRCRPSPRHFHALRLYDHIHSHNSPNTSNTIRILSPFFASHKCCCLGSSLFHYRQGRLSVRQMVC